jgi:hypothetical protein
MRRRKRKGVAKKPSSVELRKCGGAGAEVAGGKTEERREAGVRLITRR